MIDFTMEEKNINKVIIDGMIFYFTDEEECWKIKNQPKPTIEVITYGTT